MEDYRVSSDKSFLIKLFLPIVLIVICLIYEFSQDEINFSAEDAAEIAIEYVGGGVVISSSKGVGILGEEVYDVDIEYNSQIYDVNVSASTGEIVFYQVSESNVISNN